MSACIGCVWLAGEQVTRWASGREKTVFRTIDYIQLMRFGLDMKSLQAAEAAKVCLATPLRVSDARRRYCQKNRVA
jgi:hypothetical protein